MLKNFFSLKNLFLLVLVSFFGFLAGCGQQKATGQTLSIGSLKISLPAGFETNNIDSFSGDGQIIGSYKLPIQNGFSDNLLVSAVDGSGFSDGQIAKLQKNLNLGDFSKKTRSINCNKNKFDYDIINFKISQAGNLDTNAMDIYYSQGYILQSGQGYIVSFSTNDPTRSKNYSSIINSISCK